MRERSTWNRDEVMKKASLLKQADPYTMNQDHPQPPADKYVTGDPSTFAEDVHTPNTWDVEYKGDEVKRDEIGMADYRPDTFNHSEKTAREVLLKKADLCVAVAKMMLAGTKQASDLPTIENQAYALMYMPDQQLIDTHKRLAGDQQQDDDEDEGQEKQAQSEGGKKAQDQQQQSDDQGQQEKQAQGQDQQEADKDQAQDKQAKDEGGDQNAKSNKNWPVKSAAELQAMAQQVVASLQTGNYSAAQQQIQELVQQQAQGQQNPQQMQAQIQQMIQEAMGKMTQQQAPVQQQAPMQQQSDEQVLDQMLAQDNCGPMAEVDIEMDPAQMDVGMADLGPEDEALRTLFAQDDEEKPEQEQAKQAANIRTASTRTVGTRPTAGVAKLGGTGAAGGNAATDLSSLWKTAPDVRDVFGV